MADMVSIPPALESQLREVCAELDRRLREGDSVDSTRLLQAHPALANHAELAVELIYTEYVTREEMGQFPDSQAWLQRFPAWRDRLERQFRIHGLLKDQLALDDSIEAPDAGGPRPRSLEDEFLDIEEIGRGGMGVVYKARRVGSTRPLALKLLRGALFTDPISQRRFRREAKAILRLKHPNIVQIQEVGEIDGEPFLALEYVEGGNLAERLKEGPWPVIQAAQFASCLARVIHFAHQQNILHRDLKPANILLTREGQPKITDFGLATYVEAESEPGSIQPGGNILGTPSYMAPEQAAGDYRRVGPATDVYALGAILYELLTGRPPFRGSDLIDTLRQVRGAQLIPPSKYVSRLPQGLERICLKALHKSAAERYQTAKEMAEELENFLLSPEKPTTFFARTPAWILLLLASMIIVNIVFLGINWASHSVLQPQTQLLGERDALLRANRAMKEELSTLLAAGRIQAAWKAASRGDTGLARRLASSQPGILFPRPESSFLNRLMLRAFSYQSPQSSTRSSPFAPDNHLQLDSYSGFLGFAFRAGSDGLAVAQADGVVKTLYLTDGSTGYLGQTRPTDVVAKALSPRGTVLAMSRDEGVAVIDLVKGKVEERLVVPVRLSAAALVRISEDDRLLAVGTDHVIKLALIKRERTSVIEFSLEHEISALEFSRDGRRLAWTDRDGWIGWRSIESGIDSIQWGERVDLRDPFSGPVQCLEFSPLGDRLAVAEAGAVGLIQVCDVDRPANSLKLLGPRGGIKHLKFTPEGDSLLISGPGKGVYVMDLATGITLGRLPTQGDSIHQMAFAPDGRLAVASFDHSGQTDSEKNAQITQTLMHFELWDVVGNRPSP